MSWKLYQLVNNGVGSARLLISVPVAKFAMTTVGIRIAILGRLIGRAPILRTLPNTSPVLTAGICGKNTREKIDKPAPFPYKDKKFTLWRALFERTTDRFDENTKLLVVEGNVGAGKTQFAKALAAELDMVYMPEVTMDNMLVNSYGYDLRDYEHLLPESMKPCDLKKYYENPKHHNVTLFQFYMYRLRYSQYIDALAHILHTGQGVVLERCVYSDYVFLETMAKFGYISRKAKSYYYEVKQNTIMELLKPHLVIYLDVPVNVCKERIKKRGIDYEVNTKVLSPEYLQTLEDYYKHHYLKEIGKHAELLIYDWSNFGDVEIVVEDIERIDFDQFDKYDAKMADWRLHDESDWAEKRRLYTYWKPWVMQYFNVPRFDVPELLVEPDDIKEYMRVFYEVVPGNRYVEGFNKNLGDKVLLKANFPSP